MPQPQPQPVAERDEYDRSCVAAARRAQTIWAAQPLERRLVHLRRLRTLIAEESLGLAAASAIPRGRPIAEALTAEVLPLAEACRFLERNAARLLAPRRPGWLTRPLWLWGVAAEVRREPVGVVLVIGPGNYPLLLPGVQILQALAAGNAVVIKPAPGGTTALRRLLDLLTAAGFDPALAVLLPESIRAAQIALSDNIDKVLFTGSALTGGKILAQLAPRLIPATMELSGCDALIVRADADLDLVTQALGFGLRLNHGETCLAPRRVFVARRVATQLEGRLASAFPAVVNGGRKSSSGCEAAWGTERLRPLLEDALGRGAHFIAGGITDEGDILTPVVLGAVAPGTLVLREDVFAPLLSLVTVESDAEAVVLANDCPYALGASIFTRDEIAGRRLAGELKAGVVTINDVIVPTADPRVPFGGRARSGFGVTRGPEGLLELTVPKVVTFSRAKYRPTYQEARPEDEQLIVSYLRLVHAIGWKQRLSALVHLTRRLWSLPHEEKVL